MKKIPIKYLAGILLAVLLFSFSTVRNIQALPAVISGEYTTEFSMNHIGITLWENNTVVNYKNYSSEDQAWHVLSTTGIPLFADSAKTPMGAGDSRSTAIHISNSGSIDEYVRVVLRKQWVDENGNRDFDLDAAMIEMTFQGEGWLVDTTYSTDEMIILYYPEVLAAGSGETSELKVSVGLSGAIKKAYDYKVSEDGKTVTYEYLYDGKSVQIEIEADAVQAHNGSDAVKAAWGREVSVSGSSLSGSGLDAIGG